MREGWGLRFIALVGLGVAGSGCSQGVDRVFVGGDADVGLLALPGDAPPTADAGAAPGSDPAAVPRGEGAMGPGGDSGAPVDVGSGPGWVDAQDDAARTDAGQPQVGQGDAGRDDAASEAEIDACATNNGGCGPAAVFACTNRPGQRPTCAERPVISVSTGALTGVVAGLESDKTATVILGNDGYLASQVVAGGQSYRFADIPNGTYFLKVDVGGHASGKAKVVSVGAATMSGSFGVVGTQVTGAASEPTQLDLNAAPLPGGAFTFHWEEDSSRSGQNQTAYVNQPPVIQFLGQPVPAGDVIAADQLAHDYNIILSDEGQSWTQEHAYRLLETLKTIPQRRRDSYAVQALPPSKWILQAASILDDVRVAYGDSGSTVTIAEDAFTYATPRLVEVDGARGTFFSKRLHHALVRYVTHDGTDVGAVEKILKERFGCTTVAPDYAALTAPTTGETAASFQPFHPSELVLLVNMFEEMPQGYRAIAGLKYLLRRRDGVPHPRYPAAPAVAWALPDLFPNGSYIEFMESGFTADPDDVHRLILHEKGHFLWGYLFSDLLKQDWTTLGGWYPDSSSPSGWSTTKETEFVSAYAHQKNPNEDMAESLAYFVLNPDALRSRAPEKFAFVRDRIMHGDRYISTIPQALTFQVLNLYPDYTYPGKIRRVDIRVDGAPDQDKQATIEIELNTLKNVFAGASSASFRLFSSIGTYVDVWLAPTDAQGSILRGTATISKYGKTGLWRPDQIVINDAVGNQRLEGVNDFGWRLSVDNALEDVTPPRYVPNTLELTVAADTVTEADGPHPVYRAHVSWQVDENRTMGTGQSVHAYLTNASAYSHQAWGTVDPATSRAGVDIVLTDFDANGSYGVPSILMVDAAGNQTTVSFSATAGQDPERFVSIDTKTPDSHPPEVSLNDVPAGGLHRILVSAYPTHPDAPDGETVVTVSYQARDDLSGLGQVSYRLLDPQGISHFQYHYHDNFYTTFFQGDPTAWKEYVIHAVLPVGSPPGTWGLQELVALDKAGNRLDLNFVETVHFSVQ